MTQCRFISKSPGTMLSPISFDRRLQADILPRAGFAFVLKSYQCIIIIIIITAPGTFAIDCLTTSKKGAHAQYQSTVPDTYPYIPLDYTGCTCEFYSFTTHLINHVQFQKAPMSAFRVPSMPYQLIKVVNGPAVSIIGAHCTDQPVTSICQCDDSEQPSTRVQLRQTVIWIHDTGDGVHH